MKHLAKTTLLLAPFVMTLGLPGAATAADGSTWVQVGEEVPVHGAIKGIATVGCKVWIVGESDEEDSGGTPTLAFSANGGRTWKEQTAPKGDVTLDVVRMTDAKYGWAVGEPQEHVGYSVTYDYFYTDTRGPGTIFRTTDGGKTWKDQTGLPTPPASTASEDFEGLSAISRTEAWIAVSTYDYDDDQQFLGESGRILHTTNAGQTWTDQALPTAGTPVADVHVDKDGKHGWAVTDNGDIWVTVNGGNTWKVQRVGGYIGESLRPESLERLEFSGLRNGVAVGDSGLILRTTDGGKHWTRTPVAYSYDLKDVAFVDASRVWVVGEDVSTIIGTDGTSLTKAVVLQSEDGGKFFNVDRLPESDNMSAVAPLPKPGAIAAGTEAQVLRTQSRC
jgi:photosystem II stability/assembly factor-like uncharacterized protein